MRLARKPGLLPADSPALRTRQSGPDSRWNTFCEYVLLPLGSLFAIFLCMLAIMLVTTK